MAERHMSDWLKLSLDDLTKAMVVARHRDLAKTPSTANHALRLFRAVWNHARRVHDLPESPTLAIEFYEERPEGQIIEDLSVWRVAADGGFDVGAVFAWATRTRPEKERHGVRLLRRSAVREAE